MKKKLTLLVKLFENKLYIDEIYYFIFVKSSFYLGKGFWKSIDTDLIDNLGPNGISRLIGSFGKVVSRLQSGYLYHYVLSVVVGLTLFLSIYIYILFISLSFLFQFLPFPFFFSVSSSYQ